MSRWVKPRAAPYEPDEIADAEALVAFYERRLDEAYERLGELIEKRELRQKMLSAASGGLSAES